MAVGQTVEELGDEFGQASGQGVVGEAMAFDGAGDDGLMHTDLDAHELREAEGEVGGVDAGEGVVEAAAGVEVIEGEVDEAQGFAAAAFVHGVDGFEDVLIVVVAEGDEVALPPAARANLAEAGVDPGALHAGAPALVAVGVLETAGDSFGDGLHGAGAFAAEGAGGFGEEVEVGEGALEVDEIAVAPALGGESFPDGLEGGVHGGGAGLEGAVARVVFRGFSEAEDEEGVGEGVGGIVQRKSRGGVDGEGGDEGAIELRVGLFVAQVILGGAGEGALGGGGVEFAQAGIVAGEVFHHFGGGEDVRAPGASAGFDAVLLGPFADAGEAGLLPVARLHLGDLRHGIGGGDPRGDVEPGAEWRGGEQVLFVGHGRGGEVGGAEGFTTFLIFTLARGPRAAAAVVLDEIEDGERGEDQQGCSNEDSQSDAHGSTHGAAGGFGPG